ncbi:TPA: PIN-like domain-containing protein [Serratia marcescens]
MIETLLKIHTDSEGVDFKEVWKKGIFVFDSNVLLDLYRLPESAAKDLIGVLSDNGFNDKVWIGFQVLLEFLSNRHEAISDQKNKFTTVKKLLDDSIEKYDEIFENLKNEMYKLKLKQRHSLIDPDKFLTQEHIENGKQFLELFIDDLLNLENKQSDVNDEDKIKKSVLEMFNGKVGVGFTKKELEKIYTEGEERYKKNTPPGYKDVKKLGSYFVEDREFVRKFGDLILWKEIIKMAAEKKAPYVVLITGDVKEDWWIEKRGKKLGPRKELLNEIYSEVPELKAFYMYDTSSFLKHAKSELSMKISDVSITQTKDLIERTRKNRFSSEGGVTLIHELINDVALSINGIKVGIGSSVKSLPPINIDCEHFFSSCFEILLNAQYHGINNYVGVQAKKLESYIVLRFKNEIPTNHSNSGEIKIIEPARIGFSERKTGIDMIKKTMYQYGIDTHIVQDRKKFTIELYMPKSLFLSME